MEHLTGLFAKCLDKIREKVTGHKVESAEARKYKRIDKDTWSKLEVDFGLAAAEADRPPLGEPTCEKPLFELFIGIMVMINAITMAIELDLSAKDATQDERIGWIIVDVSFCAFFALEILFRIWCLGMSCFLAQPRYLADVLLVAFNIADASVELSGSTNKDLESLSVLRILRLFKIMKLLRLISHVKELSLIATGLVSALKSLQWVTLLLAVVIFVMAVMFRILMGRECDSPEIIVAFAYRWPDVEPKVKCEEFWGSVFRSMYTLYQITTMESWSEVIVRPIFDSKPEYVMIILLFQLITTFGLLNIVVAAIVDGTMNSMDEAVVENQTKKHTAAHLKVLQDIFIQATSETSPEVTKDTLLPILVRPDIRRKLLLLSIEYDDPGQIWRIVDVDGNGSCDIKDFTTNLMRMRGQAKAKDLLAIRSQLYRVSQQLEKKIEGVQTLCENILSGSGYQAGPAPLSLPPPPATKSLPPTIQEMPAAAPVGPSVERFQEELRGEIGKLPGQFQDQLGNFGRQLSKDLSGRLSALENTIFRMSYVPPSPVLSQTAAELYVQPTLIPAEQSLPFLPKPCCHVTIGNDDRQGLVQTRPQNAAAYQATSQIPASYQGNVLVTQLATVPESTWFTGDANATPGLASVIKGEHTALIRDLEEKHQLLLCRLNLGKSQDAQDGPVTASEPKAKALAQSKAASTQTDLSSEALPSEVLNTSLNTAEQDAAYLDKDKCGSLVDTEEAQKVMDGMNRDNSLARPGGFAEVLQDQKSLMSSQVGQMEKFVRGPWFEGVFAALIVANAFIMACEVQYTGFEVGFLINYPKSTQKAEDIWVGARQAFDGLELTFGIIFVLELLFKIAVLKLTWMHSAWNWLDFLIVGGWVIDALFGVSAVLNPMMLRLFRLVKLLRVAKLFKSFQAFDSLSILIGSMKASVSTLFWSIVVLFTAQLAAALLLAQGLEGYLTDATSSAIELSQKHEVYQFFGTFTRAFVTTMQLTLGNWVPVCRLLYENVSGSWSIFICLYVIVINFAAIRVISAVFIVETQKVASTDEELLILQKERQISRLIKNFAGVFKEIDSGGDGMVDWEEFRDVIHDHRVLTWLAALDLDIEQCEGMFVLLSGGDGKISFQEFVKGVQRLKGGAKAIDLIVLMNRQEELTKTVGKLARTVEAHVTDMIGR